MRLGAISLSRRPQHGDNLHLKSHQGEHGLSIV